MTKKLWRVIDGTNMDEIDASLALLDAIDDIVGGSELANQRTAELTGEPLAMIEEAQAASRQALTGLRELPRAFRLRHVFRMGEAIRDTLAAMGVTIENVGTGKRTLRLWMEVEDAGQGSGAADLDRTDG